MLGVKIRHCDMGGSCYKLHTFYGASDSTTSIHRMVSHRRWTRMHSRKPQTLDTHALENGSTRNSGIASYEVTFSHPDSSLLIQQSVVLGTWFSVLHAYSFVLAIFSRHFARPLGRPGPDCCLLMRLTCCVVRPTGTGFHFLSCASLRQSTLHFAPIVMSEHVRGWLRTVDIRAAAVRLWAMTLQFARTFSFLNTFGQMS